MDKVFYNVRNNFAKARGQLFLYVDIANQLDPEQVRHFGWPGPIISSILAMHFS